MRLSSIALLTVLILTSPAFAQPNPNSTKVNQAPAMPATKMATPPVAQPSIEDGDDKLPAKTPETATLFSGMLDPFDYDPRGRRDPFVMPVPDRPVDPGAVRGPLLPLQKFDLTQLRLVGIIWDVKHPKAMIKDPTGATHVVGPNTKVGPRNGYIAVIREGEMVVVETQEQDGKLVSSAQVVKIAH